MTACYSAGNTMDRLRLVDNLRVSWKDNDFASWKQDLIQDVLHSALQLNPFVLYVEFCYTLWAVPFFVFFWVICKSYFVIICNYSNIFIIFSMFNWWYYRMKKWYKNMYWKNGSKDIEQLLVIISIDQSFQGNPQLRPIVTTSRSPPVHQTSFYIYPHCSIQYISYEPKRSIRLIILPYEEMERISFDFIQVNSIQVAAPRASTSQPFSVMTIHDKWLTVQTSNECGCWLG